MTLYGAGLIFAILFLGVIYTVVAAQGLARRERPRRRRPAGVVVPRRRDLARRGARLHRHRPVRPRDLRRRARRGVHGRRTTSAWPWPLSGLLLGALVHGSIVLFNRPQALVPPHLRDEPGALAERRQRRRRRAGRAEDGLVQPRQGRRRPPHRVPRADDRRGRAGRHDPAPGARRARSSARARPGSSRWAAAWATFGWIPRDATLAACLEYAEAPGPSTDLAARADAETGLARLRGDRRRRPDDAA